MLFRSPISTPAPATTIDGIAHVKKLGLDAMELEFVRQVHIKEEKASLVKEVAFKQGVMLTCHGQYWVNLNARDPAVLKASIERVLKASDIAWKCGAWSICFHMAYYMGQMPDVVYENVKKNVKEVVKELKNTGNAIWLRAETGGKVNQFADVEDLIKLSQEVEHVQPCIDWAHHCARTNGKVNNYDEFRRVLVKIEEGLGKEALQNMHMHIEGIEFGEKGEKNHLNFADSQFNYKDVLKLWKEFKIGGVAICESPNIEEDALAAKRIYSK